MECASLRHQRPGFTIVELLIVIVVIGNISPKAYKTAASATRTEAA